MSKVDERTCGTCIYNGDMDKMDLCLTCTLRGERVNYVSTKDDSAKLNNEATISRLQWKLLQQAKDVQELRHVILEKDKKIKSLSTKIILLGSFTERAYKHAERYIGDL